MEQTRIMTLDLNTGEVAADNPKTKIHEEVLDLSFVLDMNLFEGLETTKEIALNIINKIKSNTNEEEKSLEIIIKSENDDTFEMAESVIGYMVEELVDRTQLRREERLLGFATLKEADNYIGGQFNLLSLLNYTSGLDSIRIRFINHDGREKGLGVLE